MKPLSELVKEFRRHLAVEEGEPIDIYLYGQVSGYRICADFLEVWLREADEWAAVEFTDEEDEDIALDMIRRELLGTTQSSGEGEK